MQRSLIYVFTSLERRLCRKRNINQYALFIDMLYKPSSVHTDDHNTRISLDIIFFNLNYRLYL